MIFLIDTDIIIYSLKNNPIVQKHFLDHALDPKTISVITFGEMVFGAKKSRSLKNLATVHRIAELFPVIDISKAIMETYGNIKAETQEKGNPIDDMDLLIAATALTQNYTLVTNNEKHFAKIPGLVIQNWTKP